MQRLIHPISFAEKFSLAMYAREATPIKAKQRGATCFVLRGRVWHLGKDGTLMLGNRSASPATYDAIRAEADTALAMLARMGDDLSLKGE